MCVVEIIVGSFWLYSTTVVESCCKSSPLLQDVQLINMRSSVCSWSLDYPLLLAELNLHIPFKYPLGFATAVPHSKEVC